MTTADVACAIGVRETCNGAQPGSGSVCSFLDGCIEEAPGTHSGSAFSETIRIQEQYRCAQCALRHSHNSEAIVMALTKPLSVRNSGQTAFNHI